MFEGVKRVDGCRYPPEYEGPASGLGGRSAANSHRYSDDYCTTDYGQEETFSANKNGDQRMNAGRREESKIVKPLSCVWLSLSINVDPVCHLLGRLPGRRYHDVCPVCCQNDNPAHHPYNPGVLHENPVCHQHDRRYSPQNHVFDQRECRSQPQALSALPVAVLFPGLRSVTTENGLHDWPG